MRDKNEWVPFASTEEKKEQWQAWLDYLKHTAALSLAISVLIMAIYRHHDASGSETALIISIGFFLSSTFFGLVAHNILIATYVRGLKGKWERFFAGWGLMFNWSLFAAGAISILCYVYSTT